MACGPNDPVHIYVICIGLVSAHSKSGFIKWSYPKTSKIGSVWLWGSPISANPHIKSKKKVSQLGSRWSLFPSENHTGCSEHPKGRRESCFFPAPKHFHNHTPSPSFGLRERLQKTTVVWQNISTGVRHLSPTTATPKKHDFTVKIFRASKNCLGYVGKNNHKPFPVMAGLWHSIWPCFSPLPHCPIAPASGAGFTTIFSTPSDSPPASKRGICSAITRSWGQVPRFCGSSPWKLMGKKP